VRGPRRAVAGVRGVSNLVALLIAVAVAVGLSAFVGCVVAGVLGGFAPSTTVSVVGGSAFLDPSDPHTVVCEVLLSIVGPARVEIVGVRALLGGEEYPANCLNCRTVITEGYPNSANDVVALRLWFRAGAAPRPGTRIEVVVEYRAGGEVGYASGTVVVRG